MTTVIQVIDVRADGTEVKRIHFIYPVGVNYLALAQRHFTKLEKKMARNEYKFNLRTGKAKFAI